MIKEIKEGNYDKIYYYINSNSVGFLEYQIIFDTLDITNLYVDKKNRNKGIATKLINYLIKNKKVRRMMLEVKSDNIVAISLYEKMDFNKINVRKKYYKEKDALVMEKIL